MAPRFGGVLGAPVTPFGAAGRVHLEAFRGLREFLVAGGVDGVAVPLHTGESINLRGDERRALVSEAVRVVAGRVPVLAHVSLPGTDQVVELARHAEAVGAAAVISVTPYHWRPSPPALLAHFTAVCDSVDVPVLAYNFPSRIGVALDEHLLERLIERCPNLAGVKDASYDMQSFTEACRVAAALRPDFSMLTGVEYLLPSMVVGGAGCFSPASSVAPRLVRDLYNAVRAGELVRGPGAAVPGLPALAPASGDRLPSLREGGVGLVRPARGRRAAAAARPGRGRGRPAARRARRARAARLGAARVGRPGAARHGMSGSMRRVAVRPPV